MLLAVVQPADTHACTCVVAHFSMMCMHMYLHFIIKCTTHQCVMYIVTCINTIGAVIQFMNGSHDTRMSGLASTPHVPHSHSWEHSLD